MKPFKQLLEEWTENLADHNYYINNGDHFSYKAGSAASNELVLQLWEALERVSNANHRNLHLMPATASECLDSIREKLEGVNE